MNGKKREKIRFGAITVALVAMIIFCTTGTVIGQEKGNVKVDEKFYHQMEQEYVQTVRAFLNDSGFENSGVSLTKVLEADGSREYTMQIHHKRIEKLSGEQQDMLKAQIEGLECGLQDSGFCHEFLTVVF